MEDIAFAVITSRWTPIITDLGPEKEDWQKMTSH